MALLFMEGFDTYGSVVEMHTDQNINGDTSGVSLPAGRIDGQALRNANAGSEVIMQFPDSGATFFYSVRFKCEGAAPIFNTIFDFGNQVGLTINSSRILTVRRLPSTTLASFTTALTVDQWHLLEVKIFMNDSTGTVIGRLDGVEEINLTSQDTLQFAPALVGFFRFTGNAVGIVLDDLYIGDTTGSDLVDFVGGGGDVHIETLDPDGDGATTDWTPLASTNISNVDEGKTLADDDTSYNSSSTVTDKDLFTMSAIVGNVDSVVAVQPKLRVRKEDAGTRILNATIRSNVTEVDSGDISLSTDWQWKRAIYENDPDGGGAWDEAAVNAMEVGVELKT